MYTDEHVDLVVRPRERLREINIYLYLVKRNWLVELRCAEELLRAGIGAGARPLMHVAC